MTAGSDIAVTRPIAGAVAVVVPAFNAAVTLAETLRSALGQEGVSEIVVVDDGSSDGTLALARGFEPDIRVLTGPNRSVSAARNTGIAETFAEWLLFLDSDDLLMPGTVGRRLGTAAAAAGADVVICDWEDMIDDGGGGVTSGPERSIDWEAFRADAELAAATHVWATTAAILYRRPLIGRIGGFRTDLPVIQDARFLLDAVFQGARFAHSAHVGARYRQLPGSLSRRNPGRFWLDVLTNGRQIEAAWRARGGFDEVRRKAVSDIYDNAARGLFGAGHPAYFEAIADQRRLGLPASRQSRISAPLSRAIGLSRARQILQLLGRA